jgi:hypothetical protein
MRTHPLRRLVMLFLLALGTLAGAASASFPGGFWIGPVVSGLTGSRASFHVDAHTHHLSGFQFGGNVIYAPAQIHKVRDDHWEFDATNAGSIMHGSISFLNGRYVAEGVLSDKQHKDAPIHWYAHPPRK